MKTSKFNFRNGHIRQTEVGKGRATFGKWRNYKRKKVSKFNLETDTFGKRSSANGRATFGKRRNYKREIYGKKYTPNASPSGSRCPAAFVNSTSEKDTLGKRPRHIQQTPKAQTGKGFRAKHDLGIEALSKDVKHERRRPKQQIRLYV